MSLHLPTFSALGRAHQCPASCVLPAVYSEREDCQRGTSRHAFNDARRKIGRRAALENIPEGHRAEAERIDVAAVDLYFHPQRPRSEVAFAYNPDTDTARELGEGIGRAYEANDADLSEEFCGTTDDFAIYDNDDHVRILDLKGNRFAGHLYSDSAQLEAQALAVTRLHGISEAHTRFAFVQPSGEVVPEDHHYNVLDLDQIAAGLRDLKQRVKEAYRAVESGKRPDLFEGDWCRTCPAQRTCPAKTDLIRAVGAQALELPVLDVSELTEAQKAHAWRSLQRYEPILKALKDAIKEQARIAPIDLGDGMVLAATEGRETIDGEIARAVLVEALGEEMAKQAIRPSVTKESLKGALGAQAPVLLERIREAGGIKVGGPIVRETKAGGRR